jgi:long-chain acyl-CoA synthetase
MNFLRDLSVNQLVGGLVGGLNANNTPAELAAVRAPTEELLHIMKRFQDVEMKEGDVLTLDFIDGVTTVALNGQAGGAVSGEAFNRALTRIWLGDKPAHPALKKAMLGE